MRHPFPALLTLLCLLAACGGKDEPGPAATGTTGVLTDTVPPGAVGVSAALQMDEGADVVVAGRVRMMEKGVFVLVDDSVDFCRRGTASDNCPTPWDYCCHKEAADAASLVVLAKSGGEPVSKADLGIRRLDLVTVSGRLGRDENGTLFLQARPPWHRGDRPDLGDDIDWEQ